jgi:L-ascorbate metabolism protein UlaG (beta-lactamase superfamily)
VLPIAVTWWGHSSATVELGSVRVATDPLFSTLLFALHREVDLPPDEAAAADLVLVSHLHYDHLHLRSLRRFTPGTPIVVPRGAPRAVRGLSRLNVIEVRPGDVLAVAGVDVEVLPAHHDGRRSVAHRRSAPALGFRFGAEGGSVWFPGDTGLRPDITRIRPVDVALAPIGGWGPSLGDDHLDPEEAVTAIGRVGARWALAVHYGTYWPIGLRRLRPNNHHHLFLTPPMRFHEAVREQGVATVPLTPGVGERVELVGSAGPAVGLPPIDGTESVARAPLSGGGRPGGGSATD